MKESKKIEKLLGGRIPESGSGFYKLSHKDRDDGNEERKYKISGNKYQLDQLEQMFSLMNRLGSEGHSSEIRVFYDGDGEARMGFARIGRDKLPFPRDHLRFYLEKNHQPKKIDFEEFSRLLLEHKDFGWTEGEDKYSIIHDYDDDRDDGDQYFNASIS